MVDFCKVNFEVRIRQNMDQMYKTMSRLVTMEATYSKDVSSRISSSFITLTQCQKKSCWRKLWCCDIKITENNNNNNNNNNSNNNNNKEQ